MPTLPYLNSAHSQSHPSLLSRVSSIPRIRILGQPEDCVVALAPRTGTISKCVQLCEEQKLSFEEKVRLVQRLAMVWGVPGYSAPEQRKKANLKSTTKRKARMQKKEDSPVDAGEASANSADVKGNRRTSVDLQAQREKEEHAKMEAMPSWVQELNTVYTQKKEVDLFYRSKHKNGISRAIAARKGTNWNIGDRVDIIKEGSRFLGHTATVQIPDFDARILVKMDASGEVKSYMANEIVLQTPSKHRRSIRHKSGHALMEDKAIDSWEFDVFQLQSEQTFKSTILTVLGLRLFQRHKFEQKLGMERNKTSMFFKTIEKMYKPVPYHNVLHAADVMRTIHYFYVNSKIGEWLEPLEKLAGLFAGAVHDVQHPGVSNQFLCQTEDPIAITYNDVSPLENMHCSVAFKVAEQTGILKVLPKPSKAMLRKLVVSMVLETDLAHHFSSLAKFQDKISCYEGQPEVMKGMMKDSRLMVMCMAIACADIAHSAKPWHLHMQWSKRVLMEFFAQGEAEAAHGLPVSSLCNREQTDVWKAQIGFIDFLVLPQFRVWCEFLDSPQIKSDLLGCTKSNRAKWTAMQESNDSQEPYKDPSFLNEVTSSGQVTTRTLLGTQGRSTGGTDLAALRRASQLPKPLAT